MRDSFVSPNYSIDRLLMDLYKGRMEDFREIMEGQFKGKQKITSLLSSITSNTNDAANKALKGEFSEVVDRLAEKQNITSMKFRRKVTKPLATLLKLREGQRTLVGTIRQLVDSPSDELVQALGTFAFERKTISQEIPDANTTKTKLIQAIASTDAGSKKPTSEEEFETSPQVLYLKYSASYTTGGKQKEKVELKDKKGKSREVERTAVTKTVDFIEIKSAESNVRSAIESLQSFQKDKDKIAGVELDWPFLYEAIAGRKEMILEVEQEYEVNEVTPTIAKEYLLFLNSQTNVSSLYPELEDGTLDMSIVKKGKTINPYLLEVLETDSVDIINDSLDRIARDMYMSDATFGESVSGSSSKREKKEDDKQYYYEDLFEVIAGASIEENELLDKYDLDDDEKKILIDIVKERDTKGEIKTAYQDYLSPKPELNIIEQRQGSPMNIYSVEEISKYDVSSVFDFILKEPSVQTILQRKGIKNPYVLTRASRVMSEGGKDFSQGKKPESGRQRNYTETQGKQRESITSTEMSKLSTNAKVIYSMALNGEIGYSDVDYFAIRNDPKRVFQSYYNLAYLFNPNIEQDSNSLEEKLNQEETGLKVARKAIREFLKTLQDNLSSIGESLKEAVESKLDDVVERKEHYENETKIGMLQQLRKEAFIGYKSHEIEEA